MSVFGKPRDIGGVAKCERCGAPASTGDYLCKSCRADDWETRYEDDQCGSCQEHLESDDKYCRYCGMKAGEGSFKPWRNITLSTPGLKPEFRMHLCKSCGHRWESVAMLDRQRYCPRCGHDTYADTGMLAKKLKDPWTSVIAVYELRRAGRISDEEADRVLQRYGDSPEGAAPAYPISVGLYSCSNLYEGVTYSAYVYENSLAIVETTSERAPGERYGLRHEVEGPALEALKEALHAVDGAGLADAVRGNFSGKDGVRKFKEFCETRGIETKTYLD